MPETDDVTPKRGMRFLHRHWVTEARTPEECVVTRVTSLAVFYRVGGADGAKYYLDRDKFPTIVKEWITDDRT